MSASPHLSDEQLSAHLDSALDAPESAAVAMHLFACSECSARMEQLRATSRAVAGLPAEAPPRELDLAFISSDRDHTAGRQGRRGGPPSWALAGLAAAAVLLITVAAAPSVLRGLGGPRGASVAQGGPAASGLNAGSAETESTQNRTASPAAGVAVPPPAQALAAPGFGAASTQSGRAPGGPQNTLAFPSAAGMTVTVSAGGSPVKRGDLVQIGLTAGGASADQQLQSPGLQLVVRRAGSPDTVIGQAAGVGTVAAGQSVSLQEQWSAGSAPANAGPGDYTLLGRVYLRGGTLLEVPVAIAVN